MTKKIFKSTTGNRENYNIVISPREVEVWRMYGINFFTYFPEVCYRNKRLSYTSWIQLKIIKRQFTEYLLIVLSIKLQDKL